VTYLSACFTRLSPCGREWASKPQTSSFTGRCLYLASKTLVLYSLQRQTPCAPRSKFVDNCLYPKGFPVLRLLTLFYHQILHFCLFSHPVVLRVFRGFLGIVSGTPSHCFVVQKFRSRRNRHLARLSSHTNRLRYGVGIPVCLAKNSRVAGMARLPESIVCFNL
jgi:hypothetical protein